MLPFYRYLVKLVFFSTDLLHRLLVKPLSELLLYLVQFCTRNHFIIPALPPHSFRYTTLTSYIQLKVYDMNFNGIPLFGNWSRVMSSRERRVASVSLSFWSITFVNQRNSFNFMIHMFMNIFIIQYYLQKMNLQLLSTSKVGQSILFEHPLCNS